MVRAILDGTKMQTRRVMKPQPAFDPPKVQEIRECPYGHPGDHLWVRETIAWIGVGVQNEYSMRAYCADGEIWDGPERCIAKHSDPENIGRHPEKWRKCPSIHMPRWASRIDLEVTDIGVERVQDIGTAGIWAEGCIPRNVGGLTSILTKDYWIPLWDSINAKRGYGWDVNPWVWVISFRRIKP